MEEIKITIVGAGVIGLAVGAELSKKYKDIFIIEKNTSFGQETSSRNSEVIHAGLYYPKESLKARACIEGKGLIYEFCRKNNIPCKRTGKLIVAIDDNEIKELEALYRHGLDSGVKDLRLVSASDIKKIEPNVEARAAILSPSTGIFDTHSFMKSLLFWFENNRGQIAYNTQVTGIDKIKAGFEVSVKDAREGSFKFTTQVLINCAGLWSDKVAGLAGLRKEEYRLKYCKGDYFRVNSKKAGLVSRLVYPVPKENRAGLGIHATLDLAGALRLGPDDEYVKEINYDIDASKRRAFYESVRGFLPFIEYEDLSVDTAGIRPKLQGESEGFRDFIIKDEVDNGLPGLINLIGIESPGLTASLSIAGIAGDLSGRYL